MRLGAWLPFARAAEFAGLFTGAAVSEATARRLTEAAGAAYEAVQNAAVAHLERVCPPPPAGPAVQQLSVDGAMVPLRGKGEWAEVKTLAAGAVVQDPPTAGDASAAGAPGAAHAAELSYFSRLADHATFSRLATVETHRRGTETAGTVCGVADGAEWCQQFFDAHRPDAVRILDFSHAAGYLAQAAQAAFGEGTAAAATWYEAQRHALRHDPTPEGVLAAVRAVRDEVATRPPGAAAAGALAVVSKSLAYLERRTDQLRYATFERQGYPIGSGIVESANKTVVEARLKGAGMHWDRRHVNPMLALRGAACSDRWTEAWPQTVHRLRAQRRRPPRPRLPRPAWVSATPQVPAPHPTPPPREPLSYGPGRPAANHPWKRAHFLLPSRRSRLASDAKL